MAKYCRYADMHLDRMIFGKGQIINKGKRLRWQLRHELPREGQLYPRAAMRRASWRRF